MNAYQLGIVDHFIEHLWSRLREETRRYETHGRGKDKVDVIMEIIELMEEMKNRIIAAR